MIEAGVMACAIVRLLAPIVRKIMDMASVMVNENSRKMLHEPSVQAHAKYAEDCLRTRTLQVRDAGWS